MAQTQRGQLTRDDSNFPAGWQKYNYTGTSATAVKATPGILHSVVLNTPIAANIINLYDSAGTQTGTFATITLQATPAPLFLLYDVTLANGLTLSAGTAANLTLSYI